ncbi:MAG: hypothetical protein K8T90_07300 [Planctomycetes bacterium]|nr:hypothetical protein [Planctomycetota bacterium]
MTARFASLTLAVTLALTLTVAASAPLFADDKPADAPVPAASPAASGNSSRRVRVKFRTGRTVEGVVLTAGTWERRDADRGWVAARREERGAGIRLWWVHDLDGFQFVAARDLLDVAESGSVSLEQSREAEKRRRAATESTDAERRRADAEKATLDEAAAKAKSLIEAVEVAKAEAAAAEAAKSSAVSPADAKRFAELLGRFPPEKWTPSTPAAIEQRRVVVGVNPTAEERAFLAVFGEWKKAWEAWTAAQAAVKSLASPAPTAPKPDAGSVPAPQPGARK